MESIYFKAALGTVFYLSILIFIIEKGTVVNYDLLITKEGKHVFIFGVLIGIIIYSFITFAINLIYKKEI